jgi:hypothetical protein
MGRQQPIVGDRITLEASGLSEKKFIVEGMG